MLALLALAKSKPLLRTQLTGFLWSRRQPEQARGSLRQSIHDLHRALGPSVGHVLRVDRNHLTLVDELVWVDLKALAHASVAYPEGLSLYQPDLLDDLTGLDPAFDRWLLEQRQSASQIARGLAERVLLAQCDIEGTIVAAEKLLIIDGGHEGAWQAVIRAYLDQGDRAAAKLASERCTAALAYAGLIPSHETDELVQNIIASRLGQPASLRSSGATPVRRSVTTTWPGHRSNIDSVRLAVLPPRILGDTAQTGLSLGLAEEITAALSRFRWISCVPSNLFASKESIDPVSQVWRQLDLDFLLDGTIQCVANRVRFIARLLDMHAGGNVVWARRFDGEMHDVFSLQDQIAAETAAQVDQELLIRQGEHAVARASTDPSAHDLLLRAIPAIHRLEPSSFQAAGKLLSAALAEDPRHAAAHAWSAYWHLFLVGQGWADDPTAATIRAGELAERAVTLDPRDARALTLVGHVRGFLHKRSEEARTLHERALSLNPSLPMAWCFSGLALSYLGAHDEAVRQINQAQQLSPHDPHGFFFDMALMMPHFLRGEFEAARTSGRRAIELNPGCSSTYKGYLATLGHLRRGREADRALARLLHLEPGFSVRSALERSPLRNQDDLALYGEGLRLAGLREG